MKRIILVILAVSMLTGCIKSNQAEINIAVKSTLTALAPALTPLPPPTPEPTCADLTMKWQTEISPMLREWDDALAVANSTARISLSEPVKDLQRIARDLEAVPAPECAQLVKEDLVAYLDAEISNYLQFMADKGLNLDVAKDALIKYQLELGKILEQ